MIRQGTTPTHEFTLPIDTSIIAECCISYAQNDNEIIVKHLADCTIDGETVSVKLTQEETFKLDCKLKVCDIQMRILTTGGDAMSSDIIQVVVGKCLNREVLA